MLAGESPDPQRLRQAFRRIPSPPRCKMCYAPFGGLGGVVLRPWFGPWEKNPQLCKACIGALTKQGPGGAEVEISLLFVDIRGSTGIGERLRPAEFSALLHVFYRLAAAAIADHEGIVDKFVGDEAIGLFIPGFAGRDHAAEGDRGGRRLIGRRHGPMRRPAGRSPSAGACTPAWRMSGRSGRARRSRTSPPSGTSSTRPRGSRRWQAGELARLGGHGPAARVAGDDLERRTVDVRGREKGLEVVVVRPA